MLVERVQMSSIVCTPVTVLSALRALLVTPFPSLCGERRQLCTVLLRPGCEVKCGVSSCITHLNRASHSMPLAQLQKLGHGGSKIIHAARWSLAGCSFTAPRTSAFRFESVELPNFNTSGCSLLSSRYPHANPVRRPSGVSN